jgi:small subunit ribosomal protein S19
MSRSLKKELFVDEKLKEKIEKRLKEIAKLRGQGGKDREIDKILSTPIEVRCRDSVISTKMVGFTIKVHNGKDFFPLLITSEHINFRLGEFAPTRRIGVHGKAGTH